jgi:hypothetical protein
MMATATGHGRESDDVWRVTGVVAMLRASSDGEARTEVTGHHGALACAVIVAMRALASLGDVGASWAGRAEPLLGQGLVPA